MKKHTFFSTSVGLLALLFFNSSLLAQVTINPDTKDTLVCIGGTATFFVGATSAGGETLEFKWFKEGSPDQIMDVPPFDTNNTSNSSTLTISNISNSEYGSYYAIVKEAPIFGDTATSKHAMLEKPDAPMAKAGDDEELTCDETTVTLNGSESEGTGITYAWTLNGVTQGNDSTLETATTGTYTLTVTNVCNMTSTDQAVVDTNYAVPTSISTTPPSPHILTCEVSSIQITGNALPNIGVTYKWRDTDGDVTEGKNVIANEPGTYIFICELNATGCSDSISVVVTLDTSNYPSAMLLMADTLTCTVEEVELTALSIQHAETWQWYDSEGDEIANEDENTATVYGPGTYVFTVSQNDCEQSYQITVIQDITPPNVAISPDEPIICEGFSVELTASGGSSYVWKPGGDTQSSISVSDAETYTVTATSASNGCTAVESVEVIQRPTPTLSIGNNTEFFVNDGDQFEIDIDADPSTTEVLWEVVGTPSNIGQSFDLSGTGDIDQVYSLSEDRAAGRVQYIVRANNQGCLGDSSEIIVYVLPESESGIFVPEILTPNGDGTNDTWSIVAADGVDILEIILYNRSGANLGRIDPATWDPTACPDGVYFYVLKYSRGGEELTQKGAISIIRGSD